MKRDIEGLNDAAVAASREKYGDNTLIREKKRGFFSKFFENLGDPIIKVLLFAVALEIIVTFRNCNWFEVGGILLAVLIATVVSTASEYGSERAFEKMQEENGKLRAKVRRGGNITEIGADEVVVGDIIYYSAGDIVVADARLLSGELRVDQSALNGESKEMEKRYSGASMDNSLLSEGCIHRGSIVTAGAGIAVVTAVGKNTYYGALAKDVQSQTRESPLKLRLSSLAAVISRIGYVMAAIVGFTYLFIALVVNNGYDPAKIMESVKNVPHIVSLLSHTLSLMITVIVVAVPEGLPMMITVVLSANMRRMLKDKVMVKKLVGIETAGSMNILFTDKTGTLTVGKSLVDRIITEKGEFKSAIKLRNTDEIYEYLLISAKLGVEEGASANSTDRALSAFFSDEACPGVKISKREVFSSDKKYSSVTVDDKIRIIKGAPEVIIPLCPGAERFMKQYKAAAQKGERVIATAAEADGKYKFLALTVMKDRLRRGVSASVAKIRSAGVSVVMITGDGKDTANAIAAECGIIAPGEETVALTHAELEQMSDGELREIMPRLRVVARALPSDKTRLVRIAQEMGLVVGMTGDGINDAPSLKLADVGFSMGSGTDIAKGAGDIVILDDSFEAITKTVLYGRTIFKSIRKFISFQLMMNIAACGVSLIGQLIGIENPITIIQMLWINIIMDTLGGLAFSGEAPLDYYMCEPPKARNEKILTKEMLRQILITGGYTLSVCIAFFTVPFVSSLFRGGDGGKVFMTAFYALFVFMGIFNCFNTRSDRLSLLSNIEKNKPFIFIMVFIAIIQLIIIYFGGEFFRSVPLSLREILNVVIIAFSVIPFDALRRVLWRLINSGTRGVQKSRTAAILEKGVG